MIRRVALALLASGCGWLGAPGGDDAGRVWLATRPGPYVQGAVEERLLDRYRNAHPGLLVSARSEIAGPRAGTPSDAFLVEGADMPSLLAADRLLDLAPYLARVAVDPAQLDPTVLSVFRTGSAVYALPRGYSPVLLAFNKDLFDHAGLAYPGDDWTWDDFLLAAHRLTHAADGDRRADQWAIYLDRDVASWLPWVWSGGGDVLCPGGHRAATCLDAPASIAAIRWYTGWVTGERIAPTSGPGMGMGLFLSGRVAMLTTMHATVPLLRSRGLRVGFVALPHRAGVLPVTALYASAYAVPRSTTRLRLSVELAATLTDSLAGARRGDAGLELPALSGAARALAASDTAGWEAAFLRAAAHGRVPWSATVTRWPELAEILPDVLDRVLGGADADSATRDVARRIDRLLGAAP